MIDLLTSYFLNWPILVGGVIGILCAIIDGKLFGRPFLGILLVVAAVMSEVAIRGVVPGLDVFYALAIIASVYALAALAGYAITALVLWIWRRVAA